MKILVSALETSANLHLGELLKYLDDYELLGIFDSRYGKPTYDLSTTAVMGFVDAIKKLPFLLRLNTQMANLAKDVDVVLLIDGSGFNLPLAKKIKKQYPQKKIIYYILPQAWAWKKGRIPKIEKYCDKLCSILPFEKDYYNDKDKIEYVGHPLLDELTMFKDSVSQSGKIVFMPGSRKKEIRSNMPVFKEVAKEIKDKERVIVIPPKFDQNYIDENYGDLSMFNIVNDTNKALIDAEFAFICSGTATLEAALIGTPFVLSYIADPIDYFIGSKLVKLKHIGLANIFFDKMGEKELHKEFVQDMATSKNLLNEYYHMDKKHFLEQSKKLREYLKQGSSKKVASIITNTIA